MRATEALWLSNPDTKLTADDKGLLTHLSMDQAVGSQGLTNRKLVNAARAANRRSLEELF